MVKKHKNEKYNNLWMIGTFAFALLFVVSLFVGDFSSLFNKDNSDEIKVTSMTIKVLSDNRCEECNQMTSGVLSQLKTIFPDLVVEELDYSSKEGKKLYEENQLIALPAFLFDESAESIENYDQIKNYLVAKGDYKSLQIGATFNPTLEICNNGIDDTGDGKVDCQAEECKSEWACVEKTDKPVVELFVMSHCPYGTQIEKGIIPAIKTLGDKVDFQLKFVNYAMHGEVEIKEQLNQYCINKEYPEQLISYLECFLEDGDGERCLADFDADVISKCVEDTDKEFDLMKNFADKTTWMGNFPPFNIHLEDNLKYDVRGSPSLIINGAEPTAGRDSASLLNAICYAFNEQPEECNTELSSASPSAGFGYNVGTATTATC